MKLIVEIYVFVVLCMRLFLSRKVFKKLGFELSDDVIHKITTCKQWAAEQFLLMLREKVTLFDSIPDQQMSPPNSSIGERSEYGLFCSFSP